MDLYRLYPAWQIFVGILFITNIGLFIGGCELSWYILVIAGSAMSGSSIAQGLFNSRY
jgi:hypothetical protein